jgi:hypothetical protein
MNLVGWLLGERKPRPPVEGRIVEVAWLPLWQCQLALHDLWENEIPATMAEDHTSMMRFAAREPMGRIFVMEVRAELARTTITECIGIDPPKQDR